MVFLDSTFLRFLLKSLKDSPMVFSIIIIIRNQKSKSSGIHPAGGLNPDPDPETGWELLRVNGEAAAES